MIFEAPRWSWMGVFWGGGKEEEEEEVVDWR
jgi:hypothetical protein